MNNSNLNTNNGLIVTNENNIFSDKKEKVQKSIKSKVDNLVYFDERAQKLSKYFFLKKFLSGNKNFFRKRQSLAIKSLIRNLNNQKSGGLIKLPTGTGKTFLFGNIIKALETPSLILVPRENLVEGTYNELVGNTNKKGIGFVSQKVQTIYGKGNGTVKDQALELLKTGEFSDTLIMTYQSFVRLSSDNPELFNELLKNIGCIISDEAHRGLGDKTKQATAHLENIITTEDETDEEEIESKEYENILELENFEENEEEDKLDFNAEELSEQKIEEIISKNSKLVHIKTTATPKLSNKEIDEEIIFSSTLSDVIRDGDLLLPKKLDLGVAQTEVYGEKVTNSDNNGPLDKFYFEDGTKVYEELTLQYLIQKEQNGGYLPTVAFCNTTEQVEFYTKYLLENGVKAIQCTTNKNGTNYHDIDSSEKLLESGDAEIIVTCSKVGESWDLPTLRGAMWLVPSFSPARVMQGTGRILRILKQEDILRIMKLTGLSKEYIEKTTNNTIFFSPNKWLYKSGKPGEDNGLEPIENIGGKEENDSQSSSNILSEVYTGLELYGVYGELDDGHLYESGISLDLSDKKIKTLSDYEIYFKENQEEFKAFGIEILDEKTIDLNNLLNPQNKNLFGGSANTNLKNLYKLFLEDKFKNKLNTEDGQKILKLFFESIGYEVILDIKETINLETLLDYEIYFKENQEEFKAFGIEVLDEKTIDLNNTGNPSKFDLFGGNANTNLKNLYKLFGNDKIKNQLNTEDGQKILKLFFESIGYEVILDIKETLLDYEIYFKENQEEFKAFGVKILDDKTIDLNNLLRTRDNNLFGGNANTNLKNLYKLFGNDKLQKDLNTEDAQKILKLFFESIGYEVILDIKETLLDYEIYFKENQEEFKAFGVKILDDKTIDLNNTGNPQNKNLFGGNANTNLKNLYKLFGNDKLQKYLNTEDGQKILKLFFESIGYEVILDIKETINLETLLDYEIYFKENQEEFKAFGIEVLDEKTIDLNNTGNPSKFDLFGGNANTNLKNLYKLFGNDKLKNNLNTEDGQKILKLFFESIGYEVILDIKETINLETLLDYEIYFKENQEEFKAFGIEVLDEKTIDLNNLLNPQNKNLFLGSANTNLKNLYKLFGKDKFKKNLNTEDGQKILKLFFESIGYEVILDIKETLLDYEIYFKENQEEFKAFGIEILDNKTIDLNNTGNPSKFDLFGGSANTNLKNLYKLFGKDKLKNNLNTEDAQKILKLFFESIGYKVILDIKN